MIDFRHLIEANQNIDPKRSNNEKFIHVKSLPTRFEL